MMREILGHLVAALEAGRDVAFCQVVTTRGSTPQKAGAALLLEPDGRQVGTLGGGCVEADVKRKAAGLIGQTEVLLLPFLLDHDPEWADGLICGGRMTILAHCPRGEPAGTYYRAYRDGVAAGSGLREAIAIDPARTLTGAAGDRFLFDGEGRLLASLATGQAPAPELIAEASSRKPSEASGWAFLPTLSRIRVVVIGAGHVGQKVATLAGLLDFEIWVVDDRPDQASRERFPHARRRIVGPIAEVLTQLEWTPETYALIVTRGHGHDQEALRLIASTNVSYVGLIGSKRKIKAIFEALLDIGVAAETLRRVAAPVGLEIGSETVDEIAVSIVAELVARRNLGSRGLEKIRSASGRRDFFAQESLRPDVEYSPSGDA